MSIKINKTHDSDAIHSIGRNDVKRAGKSNTQPIETKSTVESDKVNISSVAAETGKLIEQVKQFPDIRQDRVDEVKGQISAGNFQPSGEEIADAILKEETIVNG